MGRGRTSDSLSISEPSTEPLRSTDDQFIRHLKQLTGRAEVAERGHVLLAQRRVTRHDWPMRLKLLNGAPLREHLKFDEESLLDVAKCQQYIARAWEGQSTEVEVAPKWRDIGLENARLHTGWSQLYLPGSGMQGAHEHHSFAIPGIEEFPASPHDDTRNLDTTPTFDESLSAADEYLQHSLVFYDTLMSSQVFQDAVEDNTVNSSSFLTTSFGTTSSATSSPSPVDSCLLVLQVPSAMAVMPLGSLPSAQHLRSIYPQTPTPNFLCALMTTPERREVFVRKGGYTMDLWEVIVGDDTRSNFKITFWIRPPRESHKDQDHAQILLLQTLEQLQVGNILLLRNIALTSFRDMVYGQSLNTAITRARTSVDLLTKSGGISVAQLGGVSASVLETFMRVKRWARSHVAGEAEHTGKRKGGPSGPGHAAKRPFLSSTRDDGLPPDTMEET